MGSRAFVSSHKKLLGIASVAAVGLGIFVIVWFQPQKLFISKTVNESLPNVSSPTATASASASPIASSPSPKPTTTSLASGAFRSLEHETTGTGRLLRLPDGSHVVRFENLSTSNGPDLRVYLSKLEANLGQGDYGREFIELGALKGNKGNQNYAIPAGTDVTQFKSVVIWCVRFVVGFGVAPLQQS